METLTTIINWVWPLLVGGGGVGLLFLRSRGREARAAAAKAEAEARRKEFEAYELRIEELHKQINAANKSNTELTERIATLNRGLDGKTDRIRGLTDKLIESERALNVANASITRLTEQRDEERRLKDKYREWHCRSNVCQPGKPDPDGRRPPNPNIIGKQFQNE